LPVRAPRVHPAHAQPAGAGPDDASPPPLLPVGRAARVGRPPPRVPRRRLQLAPLLARRLGPHGRRLAADGAAALSVGRKRATKHHVAGADGSLAGLIACCGRETISWIADRSDGGGRWLLVAEFRMVWLCFPTACASRKDRK